MKSRVRSQRSFRRVRRNAAQREWVNSIDAHVGRVYIAKFGPLGTILLTLVVGLLSAVLMVLLFGALLVALPVVVLLVTAAIVAGILRVYFQRSP